MHERMLTRLPAISAKPASVDLPYIHCVIDQTIAASYSIHVKDFADISKNSVKYRSDIILLN